MPAPTLTVNGSPRIWRPGLTVAALLAELRLPPEGIAVECNREVVATAQHPRRELQPGDQVEIVQLVGGG